jgi:ubiquinol-cytochrome c reductase cytochrome b/c1 subunit
MNVCIKERAPMARISHLTRGLAVAATLAVAAFTAPAIASDGHDAPQIQRQSWSFGGVFGKYDRDQLRRGWETYKNNCQGCHAMKLVPYRSLAEAGGPEYTPQEVLAFAKEETIIDGVGADGAVKQHPGGLTDAPPARMNEAAATDSFGVVPPDFSVLAKARSYSRGFPMFLIDALIGYQEHGVDYIVALLTGYEDAPHGVELTGSQQYNKVFPGNKIAMPPPLVKDEKEPEKFLQDAKDISAFMMWAAEPKLDQRKSTGFKALLFLAVLTLLLYLTKRKIWSAVYDH